MVVALDGPLGAGKTVFVKGLAAGLEIDPSSVSSPTFVIASEYEGRAPDGSRRLLVHADLYRVESATELEGAGFLDWIAPGHVVAMEWAERARESLPQDRLWVTLATGETLEGREIVVTASGERREQALRRWQEAAAELGEGSGRVGVVVQKFGGTSVANVERIANVAARVVATQLAGHRVAVVVSAMAGETDALVKLAHAAAGPEPDPREYDALVSTGEQKTIALLAMSIQRLGQRARSFTGAQIGMRTDAAYTRARIQSIDTARIREVLERDTVAVIAGFPGHRR